MNIGISAKDLHDLLSSVLDTNKIIKEEDSLDLTMEFQPDEEDPCPQIVISFDKDKKEVSINYKNIVNLEILSKVLFAINSGGYQNLFLSEFNNQEGEEKFNELIALIDNIQAQFIEFAKINTNQTIDILHPMLALRNND